MNNQNSIHPTAQIDERVSLGNGNKIGPYTVMLSPSTILDDNWIGPSVAIGAPAELRDGPHPAYDEPQGIGVIIGSRNVIREFTTVQQGGTTLTVIGNDCYLMDKTHVAHDCRLGDWVGVAPCSVFAGHVTVGDHVVIGIGVAVHQYVHIGAHAMVGMNATVTKDVPPFALAKGTPARVTGANRVGMQRHGIRQGIIDRLDDHYRSGNLETPEWMKSPLLEVFVQFAERQTP